MDQTLKDAIASELQVDAAELKPETPLTDLENWDSVSMLTIMVLISDACGVPVEAGELAKAKTFGDLENLVLTKKKT